MSSCIALRVYCVLLLRGALLSSALNQCLNDLQDHRFYKLKSCHRSTATVVSLANFRTFERCVEYAKARKGLAINFSPPEAAIFKIQESAEYFTNCHVLGCPEVNYTNLVNDSTYDYYSLYGNLSFLENSHCIKSIGLFLLFEAEENYTNAITRCQEVGGDLAHVVSEARTNSLSLLIDNNVKNWFKMAYVGLDDRKNEGRFLTSLGDDLSCFKFRAWAPGHPRSQHRNEDCVALDAERSWRVVECNEELPFVCEIYPTSPGLDPDRARNCSAIVNKKRRKQCQSSRRSAKKSGLEGRCATE